MGVDNFLGGDRVSGYRLLITLMGECSAWYDNNLYLCMTGIGGYTSDDYS